MPDSVFLDTNILIYAFSDADPRQKAALHLLLAGGTISVQTLNEFVNVTVGKLKTPWPDAVLRLDVLDSLCPRVIPLTLEVHRRAIRIARTTGYHFYDALMLSAAIEGDCTVFYSDDLHHGQAIDGLRIRNPFR